MISEMLSKLQPITGVIFDAFGTLVSIRKPAHPYRELLRIGARQGRRSSAADLRELMTQPMTLFAAAMELDIEVSQEEMQALRDSLARELASIEPYPDAIEAVSILRQAGLRVAICSNLASPYGSVVTDLFSDLDAFVFSYAEGVMKPDPVIYKIACSRLGISPGQYFAGPGGQVVMIGDSAKCDRDGPRSFGINGYLLNRSGGGQFSDLVQFAEQIIHRNNG
jgi:HAD superfamily hydrolase (TIGR01549 family)